MMLLHGVLFPLCQKCLSLVAVHWLTSQTLLADNGLTVNQNSVCNMSGVAVREPPLRNNNINEKAIGIPMAFFMSVLSYKKRIWNLKHWRQNKSIYLCENRDKNAFK